MTSENRTALKFEDLVAVLMDDKTSIPIDEFMNNFVNLSPASQEEIVRHIESVSIFDYSDVVKEYSMREYSKQINELLIRDQYFDNFMRLKLRKRTNRYRGRPEPSLQRVYEEYIVVSERFKFPRATKEELASFLEKHGFIGSTCGLTDESDQPELFYENCIVLRDDEEQTEPDR